MRVFALALMAGLASTSAYAADAVIYEPPAPAPVYQEVPIFSWTGGYIGLQGGGLWSNSDIDGDIDVFGPDEGVFGDNFNGGLFGVYAGYNWQSGPWVFGAEGDFNGVWNDETFTVNTLRSVPGMSKSAATTWLRCGPVSAMRSTAPLFLPPAA